MDLRPPIESKGTEGALPRNVHTSPTGYFVVRVRNAVVSSKLSFGWDVFVKALLEERDELTDRKHSTRSPSKGEISSVTRMPAQVDRWGKAMWHTRNHADLLLEIPAQTVSVDKYGIYLEVWGSDHNEAIVLAVGQLMLRPLVQAAFAGTAGGFGEPTKITVPLFHNAHSIIYPIGELCVPRSARRCYPVHADWHAWCG